MSWKSTLPHLLFFIIGGGLITFFAAAKQAPTTSSMDLFSLTDVDEERMGATSINLDDPDLPLTVPLAQTTTLRTQFIAAFPSKPWAHGQLKSLYQTSIDALGANGIIEALETARPLCHDEGHDLGKVIYDQLGDIGTSLRVCQDACNSGCMHGVLMEAFTANTTDEPMHTDDEEDDHEHLTMDDLKTKINTVCDETTMAGMYRSGDCAHGVGHAVMFLSDYHIEQAMDSCALYESYPMAYYCATGAYMEYITERDAENIATQSLFYPCDQSPYPSACFRYKMVHLVEYWYTNHRSLSDLQKQCAAIPDRTYRLGCYHGLGNAHMGFIVKDKVPLNVVCNQIDPDEQTTCIDGAMERMAKFYPNDAPRVCTTLNGRAREVCVDAANRKMYRLDKSFELYQR